MDNIARVVPEGFVTADDLKNFNQKWHVYKNNKFNSVKRMGDPLTVHDLPYVLNMNGTVLGPANLSNFSCYAKSTNTVGSFSVERKHPIILFCLLDCLKLSNNSILKILCPKNYSFYYKIKT